jgi:hypothetical protein
LTLAKIRKHAEEMLCNCDLNNGIAKKFQALVVERIIFPLKRNTGMSESLSEEQSIAELIYNPLLEGIHYRCLGGIDCHVPDENWR